MGQSMLPDTISLDAAKSGLRREGVFAGLYTTAEKLAFAIGGATAAFVLGSMGYVSSTVGITAQPDSAIRAIYLCMAVLPAALIVVSCIFLLPYNLNESRLRALPAEPTRAD